MTDENTHYETLFIVHPVHSGKNKDLCDRYLGVLEGRGATVTHFEEWGMRDSRLPHREAGHRGFYNLVQYHGFGRDQRGARAADAAQRRGHALHDRGSGRGRAVPWRGPRSPHRRRSPPRHLSRRRRSRNLRLNRSLRPEPEAAPEPEPAASEPVATAAAPEQATDPESAPRADGGTGADGHSPAGGHACVRSGSSGRTCACRAEGRAGRGRQGTSRKGSEA